MNILDVVRIKILQDIQEKEDRDIFHAIRLGGCPEGCMLVEEL